jgi:hypothetical protein
MSFQQMQQGWGQSTAATQSIMRGGLAVGRALSKRRSRRSKAVVGKRRKKRASSSGSRKASRLVKGSAAAKAFMAKIRRKRK